MKKYFCLSFVFISMLHAMDDEQGKQKWDAKYYKQYSSRQFQMSRDALQGVNLSEYQVILDAGCGTGQAADYIAQQAPKSYIIGVDSSVSMIEEARKYCTDCDNVSFKHDSLEEFTLPDPHKADFIFSNGVLHWIKDQESALRNLHKNSKNGAALLLIMAGKLDKDTSHALSAALKEVKGSEAWKKSFEGCESEMSHYPQEKGTLVTLLEQTGYADVSVEEILAKRDFENIEAAKRWLMTIAGAIGLSHLSSENKEKFIGDMLKKFVEMKDLSPDGPFFYEDRVLTARATIKKD